MSISQVWAKLKNHFRTYFVILETDISYEKYLIIVTEYTVLLYSIDSFCTAVMISNESSIFINMAKCHIPLCVL